MEFKQIIAIILIYGILFFLIERVSFKDGGTLKSKIIYAVLFDLLIILYNLYSRTLEEPPLIIVTIFQISYVTILAVGYIIWQIKRKKNKKI